MSSVKFFPSRWSIDPTWTRVFCLGKSGPPGYSQISVTIPFNPYLILTGSLDELDFYVANGFLSQPPVSIGKEIYRCFFSDRSALQKFVRDYSGPAKVILPDPLRAFFVFRGLKPGNWQEIYNIRTGHQGVHELDFCSDEILSFNQGGNPDLNLFLVINGDQVTLTVDYFGQLRSHSFTGVGPIRTMLEQYSPDRVIYYIYPNTDYTLFFEKGACIDWSKIQSTVPLTSDELHRDWNEVQADLIVQELSNFWVQDISTQLESDLIKEAIDLIQMIDPTRDLRIHHPKQGIFKNVYYTPVTNFLGTSVLEEYFFGSGVEWLLCKLGAINVPNSIWIDDTYVVTTHPYHGSNQASLAIVSDSDRVLVDSEMKLHRSGMGPLTYPPFPLFDKIFLGIMESIISGRKVMFPPNETSDFIITTFLSNTLAKTTEPYVSLAKQLQELGELPVKFKKRIHYIQTKEGPILMELVDYDRAKWFAQLDTDWYNRIIQSTLGKIFTKF